ncbi:uncharacterized protein M421DRAFT_5239 [Didymella exigua CBS 183.55]|uniref:Uncharacterized protein n=1 Tax=Didymella exigua CBS 183.55 TaxID=1150837 RepID=A0A6A5RL21_9PLEO|nr:uncharacterized protein M421DRAFT_5239 [Didymella exigua CBS 183.55]KAF1928163.1 hypothetical protein M421DRAFT_5239 [Didymella exigua CBS 183.55]
MDIVKGIRGGIQGIKRMFGSQNGDAAEEANDVGSPTSQLQTAHKLSSETEGILQPPAHNADAMSTKLSHAASPPPLPATLPWASPDAFPHRTTASIDLTRGPYQDDNLPETSRKRLERLPRHSKRRSVKEHTPREAAAQIEGRSRAGTDT